MATAGEWVGWGLKGVGNITWKVGATAVKAVTLLSNGVLAVGFQIYNGPEPETFVGPPADTDVSMDTLAEDGETVISSIVISRNAEEEQQEQEQKQVDSYSGYCTLSDHELFAMLYDEEDGETVVSSIVISQSGEQEQQQAASSSTTESSSLSSLSDPLSDFLEDSKTIAEDVDETVMNVKNLTKEIQLLRQRIKLLKENLTAEINELKTNKSQDYIQKIFEKSQQFQATQAELTAKIFDLRAQKGNAQSLTRSLTRTQKRQKKTVDSIQHLNKSE